MIPPTRASTAAGAGSWPAFARLACSLIHTAYAIDPNRAMSQYVRDRWGTEQGFPKGLSMRSLRLPTDILWIGTEAGLVRFDGWNFRLDQGRFRGLYDYQCSRVDNGQ